MLNNMPTKTSFTQLIKEAQAMLMDRSEQEQDLIYCICKLDDEERAAIKFAFMSIRKCTS